MTVRELILQLLAQPMDATVYVGKGVGPVKDVSRPVTNGHTVVLIPAGRPS